MPKVDLILPNGTKVTITGSKEETLAISKGLTNSETSQNSKHELHQKNRGGIRRSGGVSSQIYDLYQTGFFKESRTLGEIKSELANHGHPYAVESLSTPMMRFVRRPERCVRRYKDGGTYKYVNN